MHLIINHSSMVPLYEQLVAQITGQIISQTISAETALPSVRHLAKELSISALTVKKAYDQLEANGLIVTVHGKGSFVAKVDPALQQEQQQRAIQAELEQTIAKAKGDGLTSQQLKDLFALLMEDY